MEQDPRWSHEYPPQHDTQDNFIREAMARLMPDNATLQVTMSLVTTCMYTERTYASLCPWGMSLLFDLGMRGMGINML